MSINSNMTPYLLQQKVVSYDEFGIERNEYEDICYINICVNYKYTT